MRVHVAKWGNSTAVRLPKTVVDELRLSPGQEMDISIENGEARLRKIVRRGKSLEDMLAEMRRLGPDHEPDLVDWGPNVGAEMIDDDNDAGQSDR